MTKRTLILGVFAGSVFLYVFLFRCVKFNSMKHAPDEIKIDKHKQDFNRGDSGVHNNGLSHSSSSLDKTVTTVESYLMSNTDNQVSIETGSFNRSALVDNIDKAGSLKSKLSLLSQREELFRLEGLFRHASVSERVVYNRVPKCGSEGVVAVMRVLSKSNHFHVSRSRIKQERFLNESQQFGLVKYIQDLQSPVVFDRHVYFTDFTKFNKSIPVYINVIRDPVERFISSYYYNKKHCDTDECVNETLEVCIAEERPPCVLIPPPNKHNRMWMTIPFFCGHEPFCRTPCRDALELAKKNAKENYLVVGILEDFETFYYILDKSMPHLFAGIHQVYLNRKNSGSAVHHSTQSKPQTTDKSRQYLKQQFQLEYEFYEFAKNLINSRLNFIESSDLFKTKRN